MGPGARRAKMLESMLNVRLLIRTFPRTLQRNKTVTHRGIVLEIFSLRCLGQETAKGPFGLRVKLPPAHLSITRGGGFTLSV